jgi:Alr-MurF fusion protein
MDTIPLQRFAAVIGGEISAGEITSSPVQHVTVHSDHVRAESVFFALRGTRSDGHQYVRQALTNGAIAAVVSRRQVAELADDIGRLIVVDDPLEALHDLARWWRSTLHATVLAVVGSNGKTITKDALAYLAAAKYLTYGSPRSYNSQLGVALAILECPRDREVVVIEAAATEPGEMARLRRIIQPHHVLITNLGTRYRVNFDGVENHARELLEMAQELPPEGKIIVGTPHPQLTSAASAIGCRGFLVVGSSGSYPRFAAPQPISSCLRSAAYLQDGTATDIIIDTPSEELFADVILAATAAAVLDIDGNTLLSALQNYSPTSTRMEVWRSSTGATIVREIAMTDGLAFNAALRTAKRLTSHSGRTIVVLAERFTSDYERFAVELGQVIAGHEIDALFGYDASTHRAIKSYLRSASPSTPVFLAADSETLRRQLSTEIKANDLVFIQSPRDISLAEVMLSLVEPIAPTRLHVDLSAIEANVGAFRRLVGPSTRLMGVIKARAYGTDPVQIAMALEDVGSDFLGVATTNEGIALREAGIRLPILVFIGSGNDVERMTRHGLTPLVYSADMLDAVLAETRKSSRSMEIHLEVDSGMHRTGFEPSHAIEVLRKLRNDTSIVVSGLMTHLGCADMPEEDDFTREQLKRFGQVVNEADRLGYEHIIRHAAATAGAIRFPEARLDMVRIGIGLYGLHPSDATRQACDLSPAISLISKIIEIYCIEPGERVGYGGVFEADENHRRFGVVPAGYFDVVPRAFGRYGYVTVNGRRCHVVGNVSMDSMVIDLSTCPSAEVGSDVLIYGQHSGAAVPLEEVASAMGFIPHELLVSPGPRVQRVFTRH